MPVQGLQIALSRFIDIDGSREAFAGSVSYLIFTSYWENCGRLVQDLLILVPSGPTDRVGAT